MAVKSRNTDRMSIGTSPANPLQLLRGRISNLRKKRCRQDFMFTQADSERAGKLSVLLAQAGDSSSAASAGLASMETKEDADFVEFDLGDKYVKAWIWMSPFEEGDEVEVVAEQDGYFWRGYGIRRASDRLVGLYPHCSKGRYAHFWTSFKWTLMGGGIMTLLFYIICNFAAEGMIMDDLLLSFIIVAMTMGLYGIIGFHLSWRYMKFVRLAEKVFEAFGWENPKSIDLYEETKKNRQPDDSVLVGVVVFRK